MSGRRAASERVGDIHIHQAAAAARAPSVINSFGNDDTALIIPRLPTHTDEQMRFAERVTEMEFRSGAVTVCDQAVSGGCGGGATEDEPGCSSRHHAGHVAEVIEALDMLGLTEPLGLREEAAPGKRTGGRRFER